MAWPRLAGELVEVEAVDGNPDIVECVIDLEVNPMMRATRVNWTGKMARVGAISTGSVLPSIAPTESS